MVDIEKININFQKYRIIKMKIDTLEKEKLDFEMKNFDELYYLNSVYSLIVQHRYELKDEFIKRSPVLERYFFYKRNIDEEFMKINEILLDKTPFNENSSFIALKKCNSDEYGLFDLKSNDRFIFSMYDGDEKKAFLIDCLKATGLFVCFAKREDLPLLMVLKEEGLSNYNMFVEFERAKMFDERAIEKVICDPIGKGYKLLKNKLPFVYDTAKMEEMWYKLDEKKQELSKKKYWIEYYKTLIISGKDSEMIFDQAKSNDHIKYLSAAYKYFSEPNSEEIHFRTANSVINEGILKIRNKKNN